jgi:hypothetical protein
MYPVGLGANRVRTVMLKPKSEGGTSRVGRENCGKDGG